MKNHQKERQGVIQMDLISTKKQIMKKHQQRMLLFLRLITLGMFAETSQGIIKVKKEDNIDSRVLNSEEAFQMDLKATKKQNPKKMHHLRKKIVPLHPIISLMRTTFGGTGKIDFLKYGRNSIKKTNPNLTTNI
ncbi:uncharacterized protein [Argopecten irradians]|uniref:uncharacterized protein isoform X2 n=1 Tax=Argopecten irradians TaxID=31199 RepID=UPI0037158D4F